LFGNLKSKAQNPENKSSWERMVAAKGAVSFDSENSADHFYVDLGLSGLIKKLKTSAIVIPVHFQEHGELRIDSI
jgi:hypothetical protein